MTLVIFGSANKNGFTAQLLQQELRQHRAEYSRPVKFFYCYEQAAAPCSGCGHCRESGSCRHRDLTDFFRDFSAAQQIIYAFPVYNGSLPAPMKAVVDRFQPYYELHFKGQSPFAAVRPATLVITAGAKKATPQPLLQQLRPVFSVTGCRQQRCLFLAGTDRPNPHLTVLDKEDRKSVV